MQEYEKNALCIGGFADEGAIDAKLYSLRLGIALKLWNRVYGDYAVSLNELPVWPTAEAYIPAHMADPARGINLPALHISRLDEKLKGV